MDGRRDARDRLDRIPGLDVRETEVTNADGNADIIFKVNIDGATEAQRPLLQSIMESGRKHLWGETVRGGPVELGGDGSGFIDIMDTPFNLRTKRRFTKENTLTRIREARDLRSAQERGRGFGQSLRALPGATARAIGVGRQAFEGGIQKGFKAADQFILGAEQELFGEPQRRKDQREDVTKRLQRP